MPVSLDRHTIDIPAQHRVADPTCTVVIPTRNERGNVLGLMPHPEHAVDPDLGATGGQSVLEWLLSAAREKVSA